MLWPLKVATFLNEVGKELLVEREFVKQSWAANGGLHG
jgi:hypothetical protein